MSGNNQIPVPQWIDSGHETNRGLDLLGLRNPVQNIVNIYLNGITTITPSIRYLSIRAFITNAYINSGRSEEWKSFRNFAGQVESAVAFGNILVESNARGVLGSDKAYEFLASPSKTLKLGDLVLQLGVNIYTGPSEQLGISYPTKIGIPGLTREKGVKLAEIVASSIERTKLGSQFLTGNSPEEVSIEDLTEFGQQIKLNELVPDENELLTNILMPVISERNERYRVMSYALLLQIAETKNRLPNEGDVLELAVDGGNNLDDSFNDVLDGWLAFLVRDQIAAAHEYVLQEIVSELKARSLQGTSLYQSNEIIGALLSQTDQLKEVLSNLGLISENENLQDLTFAEISERVNSQSSVNISERSGITRWENGINELDLIKIAQDKKTQAGTLAILPISWLLALRRVNSEPSESFLVKMLSINGNSRIGLEQVIKPTIYKFIDSGAKFLEVAADLAYRTVEQHLRISWNRFGQDPKKLVAVLTSDGQNWAFRQGFTAGRAASRISQAGGWLEQLDLINNEGITEAGAVHLKKIIENNNQEGD